MTRPKKLGLVGRTVQKVMDTATYFKMRTTLPFADQIVAEFGPTTAAQYFMWFASVIPYSEKRLGHDDAQLLIGLSAMWNGCRFCAVGHTLASSVGRYRDHGLMCPLTHEEMVALSMTKDFDALLRIEELLADPAYDRVRKLALRMYAIKYDPEAAAPTEHDDVLEGIVAAWDWLVECSIVAADTDPDDIPPLSGIAKDPAAVKAYFDAYRSR